MGLMLRQLDRPRRRPGAYALVEVIISLSVFTAISAALVVGFIALKKNYSATTDFASNHADEMRISDYLALDFRRAIKFDPPAQNDVSIYLPCYYDSTNNPQTPTLDGQGGVLYGASTCSVKVHYYLSASTIYRQEGSKAALPLAYNVQDFVFTPTDLGKVMTTTITFLPTFRSAGGNSDTRQSTAFYNTTLLRNNRGVY